MKKIKNSAQLLALVFLFSHCGNSENNPLNKARKAMKEVSETVDVVKNVSKVQSKLTESMDRMEELKEITPASMEELKTWLPEQLGDFKRSGFSTGNQSMVDISSITGKFTNEEEEEQNFEINIVDGAGEGGGMFALVYLNQFNRDFEEETQDGFSKSMKRDNKKAIVSQDNRYETAELEFLESERYYVKIKGKKLDVDDLWEIASQLKTGNLPGL